ncbi:MAG: lipopolysaccharide assembly protein A [Sodalis sp. Fle]|nr:MAG: lipopolysaccharide assembly protein A [Sodalis sp. Fle]
MKYVLVILLVLVIFIISVTLGMHNDQVLTFNLFGSGSISSMDLTYRPDMHLDLLLADGFCSLFWLRIPLVLLLATG